MVRQCADARIRRVSRASPVPPGAAQMTPTTIPPEHLDEIAGGCEGVTPGPWHAGCLADDLSSCNCRTILSETCCGGIGEVFVDNSLPIPEGGNDAPPLEEAKANLRHIARCDPQTILALVAAARENERLREALEPFAEASDRLPT